MPTKKNVADKPTPANKQKGEKTCSCCGEKKSLVNGFYASANPLYSSDKRVPICKTCIRDLCINSDTGEIEEVKLNNVLKSVQKPYFKDDLASAYSQFAREHSYIDESDVKRYGEKILGLYFKNTMLRQNRDLSYDDSELQGFMHQTSNISISEKQKIINKYSDIQTEKENDIKEESNTKEISWSEQDIKNRNYAIEVIGYDPFDGYPEENKKFLFNSLSPYLEDDDNVDDAYKLSQILQIIENNMQIRVCDKKIANLDPLKNAPDIKTLSGIKNQLVQSNDKIAKENEISVRNRSNKDAGKSSLTYLMRDLREKDFDKAEADYYDQLKSPGSQWAISISQKAMLDHCMFDENDKKEVYENQLQLIDELYKELDSKKEEIRLLLIKVDELTAKIKDSDTNGIS